MATKPRSSKSKQTMKKTYKKRNYRKSRQLVVNKALHPIPQRFITKMKYADLVATDVNGQFYFNLNSVFDPNRTGVGHQPYGHDTLATLYNRYRVISCGYRIMPVCSPQATAPIQFACMPGNEQQLFSNISEVRENPRAKYIIQNPNASQAVLSGKVYIPSLVGRSKLEYMADDRYQAAVGTSPSELAILNCVASNTYNDVVISGLTFNIILEYTVEWFDVKTLTQS